VTTIQKSIICGVLTEAIAASFIVIDYNIGIEAASRFWHDQASWERAMQSSPHIYYFLSKWTHWPAVFVLSILDLLAEAILGLSDGKPIFFDGFGSPRPAWGVICVTQAFIWIAFWAFVFIVARSIQHRLLHAYHRTYLVILGVLLIAAIFAGISLPLRGVSQDIAISIEVPHARQVYRALKQYAKQHDGKYPQSLSDLPVNYVAPEARQFHDPKTKQAEDWLYYPGYTQKDPIATIILASPKMVVFRGSARRIAFCAEPNHIGLVPEDAFVQQISSQLNARNDKSPSPIPGP
jgi:hypothetical protein